MNKYIRFEECQPSNRKTKAWLVVSKSSNAYLATISWYSPWRQYTLKTFIDIVFNSDCLEYITEFLREQNRLHKEAKVHD